MCVCERDLIFLHPAVNHENHIRKRDIDRYKGGYIYIFHLIFYAQQPNNHEGRIWGGGGGGEEEGGGGGGEG